MWDFPRRAVLVVAGVLVAGVVVVGGALAASQPADRTPVGDQAAPTASFEPVTPVTVASTPPPGKFPTRDEAGLPSVWSPRETHDGDLLIDEDGTVVQDLRITNGTVRVTAKNVTLRRVHAVNTNVQVGGIVTGVGTTGIYVQDPVAASTAASGST